MHDDRWPKSRPRPPLPGVPVLVEDEVTPPPLDPTVAIAELWPARKLVERIETVESKLDLLALDITRLLEAMNEFVKPAIKDQQGRVALLLEHHNQNLGRQERFWDESWPRVVKQLDDLAARIARCERMQDRAEADIRALVERTNQENTVTSNRLSSLEVSLDEHDARMRKLETGAASAAAVEVALTTAQKRKYAGIGGVFVAIAGAVTHLFR